MPAAETAFADSVLAGSALADSAFADSALELADPVRTVPTVAIKEQVLEVQADLGRDLADS